MIWDAELAALGSDGCVESVQIPLDIARFLSELDAEKFPILSGLSLNDYDMFSASDINPKMVDLVKDLEGLLIRAKNSEFPVLFDPFRRVTL